MKMKVEAEAEAEAEDFLSKIILAPHDKDIHPTDTDPSLKAEPIQNQEDQSEQEERKLTRIHPQHDPGSPNSSIIIHGLNYSTTQESLYTALKESGAKIESVRLVIDKQTLKSRGFAFCRFYSERFAVEWVSMHLTNGGFILDDFITRIEYCRERNEKEEKNDWHCFECASKNFEKRLVCFRCGMEKSLSEIKVREMEEMDKVNEGLRDVGTIPFHILLFRGLDPLTTEDAIWQNTILICKPSSIWLVKDRKTRTSLGHCFVCFPSIESATKLLNKLCKGKDPKPFYIETQIIQVSYAHMGSFIPSSKPNPFACLYQESYDGGPKMYLSYWDSSAFCRPYPQDKVDPSIPPLPSIEEYMERLHQQQAELEKEHEEKQAMQKKKKNGVGITTALSSKMSQQMMKWSEKKKEIGDLEELMESEENVDSIPDSLLAKKISSVNALNDEFSDLSRIACLLPGCRRKFTSIHHLTKHQKESPFHAQKMRVYRRSLISELRSALMQGKGGKGSLKPHHLLHTTAQTVSRKIEKVQITQQPTRHGIKSDNIGNVLLQKLGWQAGMGLGKDGEGIKNPIKIQANGLKKGLGLVPRSVRKK